MGDMMLTFGEWLEDEIRQRHMSPRAFALQIGAHPSTVARWVNNERPRLDTESYQRIADGLGLPVEYVMFRHGVVERLPAAPRSYELQRELRETREQFRVIEEVLGADAKRERAIPLRGRGPANHLRWAELDEGFETVQVPTSWVAHARAPFAIQLSGDCLIASGLLDGMYLVFDEPRDPHQADDGDLVLVRIVNDDTGEWEHTVKFWRRSAPDTVELCDAENTVVARFLTFSDRYTIMGIYTGRFWGESPMPRRR